MMCPCGAVDLSLRSGETAAPLRPRLRPRPRVERGRDSSRGRGRALGSGEAEISSRGRGRGRALGSGEAEISSRGRGRGQALGSGEVELPVAPETELDRCWFRPGGWHSSRSGADDAVFLLDRSVKGRSDCGHFDLAD
jgi:hypothetical protein